MKSLFDYSPSLYGQSKKKRRSVSFTEKVKVWEMTKGHVCHICKRRIRSLTEAEYDHVRAHSKGGQTQKWAHRACNRIKGNNPLSVVQKRLGIYKPKKHKIKRKRKKCHKSYSLFGNLSNAPKFQLKL